MRRNDFFLPFAIGLTFLSLTALPRAAHGQQAAPAATPAATTQSDADAVASADGSAATNPQARLWTETPENTRIPVSGGSFDRSGYQLFAKSGELILVPFANENLYPMKFALSNIGESYFVREGKTPILYLTDVDYLQNASVPDTYWYPVTREYGSSPVYVAPAPNWNAFTAMNWYPNMVLNGGAWIPAPGGPVAWMPGYSVNIAGTTYWNYPAYVTYYQNNPGGIVTRVVYSRTGVRLPAQPAVPAVPPVQVRASIRSVPGISRPGRSLPSTGQRYTLGRSDVNRAARGFSGGRAAGGSRSNAFHAPPAPFNRGNSFHAPFNSSARFNTFGSRRAGGGGGKRTTMNAGKRRR